MDHHHHHHHQHQHQHHHREPPHHHREPPPHHHSHPMYPTNSSLYMISTPNYTPHNPAAAAGNRFPFNSPSSPPRQTVATPPSKLPAHGLEPMTSPYSASAGGGDGGSGGGGYGFDPNSQKKKRGRPRKYSPDNGGGGGGRGGGGGGGIALGLSPTPLSSTGGGGGGDSTGVTPLSENSSKKNRGRPSGSSKKQLDALGNCGVGFTPHVILVNAGEDIASKILAFSKQGARTVCVLSANGSICNVDLRQPAMPGGVVKYEGRFEIISLSGSYLFSESSGCQVRSGLSVSLAGTDGSVLGGGVVGALRAATPVQIIVGSFIADGKKSKSMPAVTQSRTFSFSAQPHPPTNSSPTSQDASSEGSDENENVNNNHISRNMSSYGNSSHTADHNMQIYSHMNWPNPASKMLQN